MQSHYAQLANQIIQKNDEHSINQLLSAICEPSSLEHLLREIPHSDVLHFTFTELLSKTILKGEFCPVNQTKSDDNSMKENENEKSKLYAMIIPRIFENVCQMNFEGKEYVLRSGINVIAVSLKDLCDNNKNMQAFVNLLENCLFPSFRVNDAFTSSLNGDLTFLEPSPIILGYLQSTPGAMVRYGYGAKVLIELIEYVTMVTVYKTYYEYRRNIYTFRNTYLSAILNVAVEHHKALHQEWKRQTGSLDMIKVMNTSIQLIDKVIAYPFSLTLHQFQAQDQTKDSVVGLNSDIYFPSYYRNVLCDFKFLDMVFEYFMFLVKELNTANQLGDTIYTLVRIVGRLTSASVYTFNSEDERRLFRARCVDMTIALLFNFKFFDPFYLHSLSEIFCKLLTSYATTDLQEKRLKLYEGLIFFCDMLIENCQIRLEDGKRDPFSRVFDILVHLINQTKDSNYSDYVLLKSQEILNKTFVKLYSWEYAEKIMGDFGKNKKSEIECFQELYQNVPAVFALNMEGNLANLKQLQIQTFSQCQKSIWLHLCAVLLPSHLADISLTEIILKYFRVAREGKSIASLHYIQVLVNQVLTDMENGIPSTPLWTHITELEKCTFTEFILFVLKVCKENFAQTNTDIIDYALEVFKSIYLKLKKHSVSENSDFVEERFNPFYDEVKQLIGNLGQTVFENQKFFKRRVGLFSVISTIWVTSDNFKYLQEIYELVAGGLRTDLRQNIPIDPVKLLRYMYDIRGLLEPIQDCDSFKIVCELAIQDLSQVLPLVLNSPQTIATLFGEEVFLKAFCKMVLQFVTDYSRRLTYSVQTELPFLIDDLFKPYLLQASKYEFPRSLVSVWIKFSNLNPLEQMLPLIKDFKDKDPKQFGNLIKEYFDNIHRVEMSQLESLYPYIQDKVEFLCQWWEEVIRRKLYPSVSLVEVVQSRIATTRRQKEELAKLLFLVGSYDQKYWNLNGCKDQRQFVRWFMDSYKGWRD